MSHELREILVADQARAWLAAGFSVVDDCVALGGLQVRLDPAATGSGIVSVATSAPAADVDGLVFGHLATATAQPVEHENGIDRVDHLVVTTPDCDRTTEALIAWGLDPRRVRRFESQGSTRRQTFFWLGAVILELVGPDEPSEPGSAMFWGLALTAPDLDATTARLGDRCGPVRDAIQAGRRIAPLRTTDLGISVPIAVMSPHHT